MHPERRLTRTTGADDAGRADGKGETAGARGFKFVRTRRLGMGSESDAEHVCDACGKSFDSEDALVEHVHEQGLVD